MSNESQQPVVAGHDERCGHDTMRGAMEIAAQSVVAYLPIVRCLSRRSRVGMWCLLLKHQTKCAVRSIWRWYWSRAQPCSWRQRREHPFDRGEEIAGVCSVTSDLEQAASEADPVPGCWALVPRTAIRRARRCRGGMKGLLSGVRAMMNLQGWTVTRDRFPRLHNEVQNPA